MSSFTFIVCHGDLEQAWARSICDAQERQQHEDERDELINENLHLDTLALHDAEEDGCDPDEYVPWYADRPYAIEHPQVFKP